MAELVYARRSERRARFGHASSTLALATDIAGATGVQLTFIRSVRSVRYRDLQLRVGQCSLELHKLRPPGATPGPAIFQTDANGRVRKQAKRPGREPPDSVGSIPTSVIVNTIPWSNGEDTCPTCRRRWFNSIPDHSTSGKQVRSSFHKPGETSVG